MSVIFKPFELHKWNHTLFCNFFAFYQFVNHVNHITLWSHDRRRCEYECNKQKRCFHFLCSHYFLDVTDITFEMKVNVPLRCDFSFSCVCVCVCVLVCLSIIWHITQPFQVRSQTFEERLSSSSCLYVRLSVRLHGKTRFRLEQFSLNFIMGDFTKICQ